jgi:hypothetical protein
MNNYTKVSNQVLEDATLSLKAKGLFAYLVKLPEGWKIRIVELAKHHKDSRDSIRTGITELLDAGYLERLGRSRDKGQLKDYEYRINTDFQPRPEKPTLENPVQVKPSTENPVQVDSPLDQTEPDIAPRPEKPTLEKPTLEKPTLENPTLYIKDLERKELIKEKTNKKERTPLPAWLSEELWEDFKEHRKLYRKPLTPLAATRILKTLEQVATDYSEAEARQCLDTSIANGWLGVFPPKAPAATSPRYQSLDERNQSVFDDFLKGDTDGKQGNDHQSAEELGGQHWADHFQRPALRVV